MAVADHARPDLVAHAHATRASFEDVATELRELLGAKLVAYLGGVGETRAVHQWAEGERMPSEEVQQRLRFALRVALPIANADSAKIAQAWFQGLNPQLDDRSPARLLRDGELDEVGPAIVAAERAFLIGGVTPALQVVRPDGPLHRVGRVPDAWALAPWAYAGPDNTFGNRYDDPEGEYRVLYAAAQRRGAFLETLARFRPDPQLIAEMAEIDDDPDYPTTPTATVPREWLETRCVGAARADSLLFVDISHSESLAHLRHRLATRLVHYGLDDLDAGDIRRRTPRALTQEVSRYVFGRPEAYAGIRYLSRLGDELTNWGIFEGSEPDEILEENETIDPDDPDFVSALETLDLTLD